MAEALRIGCVVMAAGNAARFGGNKLAARLDGRTLAERALDAVPAGLETVVVTQYPAVAALAAARGFRAVQNERPDWGISHTIRLGTQALSGCGGILYLVSDQPLLTRGSVEKVVRRWLEDPTRIAAAGHGGVRGNPCLFPRAFFPELLALREDHGGNTVLRRHERGLRLLEVPEEELTDVDTPQALAKLKEEMA